MHIAYKFRNCYQPIRTLHLPLFLTKSKILRQIRSSVLTSILGHISLRIVLLLNLLVDMLLKMFVLLSSGILKFLRPFSKPYRVTLFSSLQPELLAKPEAIQVVIRIVSLKFLLLGCFRCLNKIRNHHLKLKSKKFHTIYESPTILFVPLKPNEFVRGFKPSLKCWNNIGLLNSKLYSRARQRRN